jgi:hypothetical protein
MDRALAGAAGAAVDALLVVLGDVAAGAGRAGLLTGGAGAVFGFFAAVTAALSFFCDAGTGAGALAASLGATTLTDDAFTAGCGETAILLPSVLSLLFTTAAVFVAAFTGSIEMDDTIAGCTLLT